ncbi:MAG: lipoyl synthase [Candidatus Gastranaerophilaceae bacterium]|nr:lipoyl synthase [Candidatus Gastranaerophilaceae bacterium]
MKIFYIVMQNDTTDELSRTQKKKFQSELGRYIVDYVGKNIYNIPNRSLTIEKNKPKFTHSDIKFSISHSNNIVAVAFDDYSVGIDIEQMKDRDFSKLGNHYGINTDNKTEFYKKWTQLEAEIKIQAKAEQTYTTEFENDYMLTIATANPQKTEYVFEKLTPDNNIISKLKSKIKQGENKMPQRLPDYLKRPIINTETTKNVRKILKNRCLNTVCENARCPNKNECYTKNTATFLIMGNVCTRNCRYCNISCQKPEPLDKEEPLHIAQAVKDLGLKYAVITSVTRDDLADGGAEHFEKCIQEIRKLSPDTKIEILTPDFKGDANALNKIIFSKPDVFNHNIETVRAVFKTARPQGDYDRSLNVLKYIKANSDITTKSGLMVGLGETVGQIEETLVDLKNAGCDIVTIGQYIQPSKEHLEVSKYYTPEEFEELQKLAQKVGIKHYQINPLVRSSYRAAEMA